ncbi:MAG TPA: SDR family oxidoreductase [Flavobacteriales bacterium]|nr:SDR family oxidoreductase [Flavobacteriales bacterium]
MFEKKVVLVTGASSGIGQALALAFNKAGAVVIGAGRNLSGMHALRTQCEHPQHFHAVELDLEKSETFIAVVQDIINRFGQIDILVNNGGISQRSNARETALEIDRKIMEVNYFGNIALTKAVLPYMHKQKGGHVVVISSIAGKFGFYLRSAYAASKHALHGFYESLRMEEEEKGIKVLVVCPGKVATNISVNALTGDGNNHAKMDKQTQEGVSAEYCANEILKGIVSGKEELFIGGKELRAVRVKRFFPKLFSRLIKKQPRE